MVYSFIVNFCFVLTRLNSDSWLYSKLSNYLPRVHVDCQGPVILLRVRRWFTVLIRFIARGAYLPLVPQGRVLIWDGALISFLRNNRIFKTNL